MKIVIDTKEQQAWSFPRYVEVKRQGLPTADYALEGDLGFAIERKSLNDFVKTVCTKDWGRFSRELLRMMDQSFPARVIIVEALFTDIIYHKYNHPDIRPKFVIKRISELTMMRVSILFCDNPTSAAGLCWKILQVRKGLIEDE